MNRIFWFLAILLTLAASSKGYFQNWENRIVGGDQISIEDAPYQAALYKGGDFAFCGGTIIAPRFVLTAAHCFDYPDSNVGVRVGTDNAFTNGRMIRVKNLTIHENYDEKTINFDFALLELDEEIKFDKTMQPMALPQANEDVPDGTLMKITGWGHRRNPNENGEFLRSVLVPKVNQSECVKAYPKGRVTDQMLCAGFDEGGKDACSGDSGGPLVNNGTLVGVASWGNGCAKPGFPGVYARVASVIPWIEETMNMVHNSTKLRSALEKHDMTHSLV